MASMPKSDAAYAAFKEAMAFVCQTPSYDVPMHLRNAPTKLMQQMGYGQAYRHAHSEALAEVGAFAAGENYFPNELQPTTFYHPANAGLESKNPRTSGCACGGGQRCGQNVASLPEAFALTAWVAGA